MQFSPAAMYGNQRNSRATNQFYRKEILKNEKLKKKKPDGEGAGQDFTHPYFLKKGCS